jgi:hypothetical protein
MGPREETPLRREHKQRRAVSPARIWLTTSRGHHLLGAVWLYRRVGTKSLAAPRRRGSRRGNPQFLTHDPIVLIPWNVVPLLQTDSLHELVLVDGKVSAALERMGVASYPPLDGLTSSSPCVIPYLGWRSAQKITDQPQRLG